MVLKLKRGADSLEVDTETFIIILVTVSENVFTGIVVNNICMHVPRHIFKQLIQISAHE